MAGPQSKNLIALFFTFPRKIILFTRINNIVTRSSLAQRFRLTGLVIMILGTIAIGKWVGEQIKNNVIKESAATTALYMDSFITPNLQELANSNSLTTEHFANLDNVLSKTDLGRQIVSIKVWGADNNVLYSNSPSLIGHIFPFTEDLEAARKGQIVASISNLQDPENVEERKLYSSLLEIYIPVRLSGTNKIIAVVEFYRKVEGLETEIASAQRKSWFIVVGVMTAIYMVLIGFAQWFGDRIRRQENELKNQVVQLTELLARNAELDKRMRQAAANTTALNESLLRRTSAELHDGPVQEVSLALLRLDRVNAQNETCRVVNPDFECNDHLPTVQTSLQIALHEMRTIATSLGLPQLDKMALPEVFARVVRAHEKRTRTKVALNVSNLPEQATLPVKITIYRLIQEALNNAYNHAGGANQQIRAMYEKGLLQIEISDKGRGFDTRLPIEWEDHLGLAGMRERVESLGGLFEIQSAINEGTIVNANLFLQNVEINTNG
jgi:signal transduction histidine kinase